MRLYACIFSITLLAGCGGGTPPPRYEIYTNNHSDCASYLLDKQTGDVVLLCSDKMKRVTLVSSEPPGGNR